MLAVGILFSMAIVTGAVNFTSHSILSFLFIPIFLHLSYHYSAKLLGVRQLLITPGFVSVYKFSSRDLAV